MWQHRNKPKLSGGSLNRIVIHCNILSLWSTKCGQEVVLTWLDLTTGSLASSLWFVFISRYWLHNRETQPHILLQDGTHVLSFNGEWLKFRFVVKFCELKKCENASYASSECHSGNTFTLCYTLLGELPGLLVSVFSIFKVFMDLPPNCDCTLNFYWQLCCFGFLPPHPAQPAAKWL